MDENTAMFLIHIGIILLCVSLFAVMPRLTRKSYLFGVKIPPEEMESVEAKELKARYIRICIIGGLLIMALCVAQFLLRPDLTVIAIMYSILLIIPLYLIAFVPNWKRAVKLKEERGWKASNMLFAETSSSQSRGNLSNMPRAWYVVSFIFIIATFIIGIARFPVLPDMIAIHLDENFDPTRFVEKTWISVLMLPLISLATLALMVAVGISIEKAKLQIDPHNPRKSFAQHRVYRRRMGHALGFVTVGIILLMSITWLPIVFPDSPLFNSTFFAISVALVSVPLVFIIIVILKTGQGGNKVKVTITEDDDSESGVISPEKGVVYGRGDDKYWKIGTFYYNPDDPAFIVEDRFGTNIGFNYARLPAKILIALTVVGLVAVYVWITSLIL